MSVIPATREAEIGTRKEVLKILSQLISWVWWYVPVVSATQEV
jgi:hypothetical protein